jgi:cellulose synthase (UDP-forming)
MDVSLTSAPVDPRLAEPDWRPRRRLMMRARLVRVLVVLDIVLAIRYAWWLLEPGRSAHLGLYVLLVVAEGFNMLQAFGFWWTVSRIKPRPANARRAQPMAVDVFIPTYNEPREIVEPTLAAAMRLHGHDVHVALLDDGGRPEMAELADRYGARCIQRPEHHGAKAGNINWALERTDAPFIAVLDCDHVPAPEFVEACLAEFDDPRVALVQTPQYYANWRDGGVAAASWSQQSLFFGTIAVGRDRLGAMFCCGTNMMLRREALEDVGGFPDESLTEDFELSIYLHQRRWATRYLPDVLASGLAPEDASSYVSQQLRWARGCLSAVPTVFRARLALPIRLQYLLSAAYWLTGWTLLVYMTFPVIRILTGAQPVTVPSAEQFILFWGPYFFAGMLTVAIAGANGYSYSAFAVMSASFWIHILATVLTVMGRKGTFAVTPKRGSSERQLRPVAAPIVAAAVLVAVAAYGITRNQSPGMVTNVAFASVHVIVLLSGVRILLRRSP